MINCQREGCALWVIKTKKVIDERGGIADSQIRACAAAFMAASTGGNWSLNG